MSLRHLLTLSISTLLAVPSFAAPGIGRPRIESGIHTKNTDRSSEKGNSSGFKEETSLERLNRFEAESTTLSKLELSRNQMKALIREFKVNPTEYASFQRLIRSAYSSKESENTSLLRNYFQLLSTTSGEFHLSPSLLEERLNTWSSVTKDHLSTMLETSVQFAKQDKIIFREQAFEKALNKFGIDTEYQKKCRRS